MSLFLRRALIGIALAVLVYVGWVLYHGADRVGDTLSLFDPTALLIALALSSVNYLLRFLKWEWCLGWLSVREGQGSHPPVELSRIDSLLIYLAGLSMSVTPGKIGEVLRSTLLKSTHNVPFARTAPVVVADRLTDLIALVLLSTIGLALVPETLPWLVVTTVLIVTGVAILSSPKLLHRILDIITPNDAGWLRRTLDKVRTMIDSAAILLHWRRLAILTAVSVVGWGLECWGYFFILNGFSGVDAGLRQSAFLWSSTTLIGAISFLPGGLGATEYSLGLFAQKMVDGLTPAIAVTSTLLIRGATLWYGELVGAICLFILLRDPRTRSRPPSADTHANPSAPPS